MSTFSSYQGILLSVYEQQSAHPQHSIQLLCKGAKSIVQPQKWIDFGENYLQERIILSGMDLRNSYQFGSLICDSFFTGMVLADYRFGQGVFIDEKWFFEGVLEEAGRFMYDEYRFFYGKIGATFLRIQTGEQDKYFDECALIRLIDSQNNRVRIGEFLAFICLLGYQALCSPEV